jgi:hypothetical protein
MSALGYRLLARDFVACLLGVSALVLPLAGNGRRWGADSWSFVAPGQNGSFAGSEAGWPGGLTKKSPWFESACRCNMTLASPFCALASP